MQRLDPFVHSKNSQWLADPRDFNFATSQCFDGYQRCDDGRIEA